MGLYGKDVCLPASERWLYWTCCCGWSASFESIRRATHLFVSDENGRMPIWSFASLWRWEFSSMTRRRFGTWASTPKEVKQPTGTRGSLLARPVASVLCLETSSSNICETLDHVPWMWRKRATTTLRAMIFIWRRAMRLRVALVARLRLPTRSKGKAVLVLLGAMLMPMFVWGWATSLLLGRIHDEWHSCYIATLHVEWNKPRVKKVMKRGYKDKSGRSLGYAILCYRDVEEATQVRKALDGLEVSLQELYKGNSEDHPEALEESFVIRVHQAEHGDSTLNQPEPRQLPSDPPLLEQLRPLPLSELQKRVASKLEDRERLLELVAAKLESPRKNALLEGSSFTSSLVTSTCNWTAALALACQESSAFVSPVIAIWYFIGTPRIAMDSLRSLCSDLMNWADPSFHYSGIAVTKNFVASPHIDEQDKSFQFAVSLGDFHGGEPLHWRGSWFSCHNRHTQPNRLHWRSICALGKELHRWWSLQLDFLRHLRQALA